MKIGELAKIAGCKVETVRYYEKIGLMAEPDRTEVGYRVYRRDHLKRLVFIRRCRELGFGIDEIRALLDLVGGGEYSCSDVNTLTMAHIKNIRLKISDLTKLEKTLMQMASQCSDEAVSECPIIDALFE